MKRQTRDSMVIGITRTVFIILLSLANYAQESIQVENAFKAAREGNIGAMGQYLDAGGNPNAVQAIAGFSLLEVAAENGEKAICDLLISKGSNINYVDMLGETALFRSIKNKEMCEYLLSKGAKLNIKNRDGYTPLHFAGNKEIAALLLENGAGINERSNNGAGPLQCAVLRGDKEMCEFLISKGANITYYNEPHAELSDFDAAEESNHFELFPILLKALERIKDSEERGRILLNSSYNGSKEACIFLISQGVNVNYKMSGSGYTPLMYAVFGGNYEVCEVLLNLGAFPNIGDRTKRTALHYAAEKGNQQICQLLIEKGADVNIKTEDGFKPSMLAKNEKLKTFLESKEK